LLFGAVLLGAAVGFCVSLWSWPEGGAGGAVRPLFAEPAFSPSASAADLEQAAERAAEELARALPEAPEAQQVLAQTRGRLGALGSHFGEEDDRVAAARQMALETHFKAGRCYHQHEHVEAAVEMLRSAAALSPQDVPSRTELFVIYAKTGRDREALGVCRQLSRIEPERGDHWLNLALLRVRRDDLEGAKARWSEPWKLSRTTPGTVKSNGCSRRRTK
jgi:Flp pilus assembly protein TadD